MTWTPAEIAVLVASLTTFAGTCIFIALVLMRGLYHFRGQVIPAIVNVVWLVALLFMLGGIYQVVIFLLIVSGGWKFTFIAWVTLMDLVLLALVYTLVIHRQSFKELAALNAQRWGLHLQRGRHE